MKVILFGEWEDCDKLETRVKNALNELWLVDFIELETSNDVVFQTEMWIKQAPALVIAEETIDFKDVIFEWMVPEEEEIKSMFVSIIWGGWWGSCSDEWGCWTCSSGCG